MRLGDSTADPVEDQRLQLAIDTIYWRKSGYGCRAAACQLCSVSSLTNMIVQGFGEHRGVYVGSSAIENKETRMAVV